MFAAWGDESVSRANVDPGVYIFAAAMCHGEPDNVRQVLSSARLKHESKVHWHGRDTSDRMRIAMTIRDLPVEALVVVRHGSESERLERRRRKCLSALLINLSAMGCSELTLESRGTADDRKDIRLLDYMRRSRMPVGKLHLTHAVGPHDPLLWIPDVMCGAVTQHRVGDRTYSRLLEPRMTVIETT